MSVGESIRWHLAQTRNGWIDMVEEYETVEVAKLAEGNGSDNDATSNVGQRTIFSRVRRWVAKRLKTVTVCCSGPRGHGRSANHLLPRAM